MFRPLLPPKFGDVSRSTADSMTREPRRYKRRGSSTATAADLGCDSGAMAPPRKSRAAAEDFRTVRRDSPLEVEAQLRQTVPHPSGAL
jgi:hypothetical protein